MTRILLTICILLALLEPAPAFEVTFKQSAQVDDAVIKLGDVARCDEDSPMAEALASQPVGQAPNVGETLVLRSQNIKQYLLSSHSLPDNITWNGSPTIRVSRQGVVITAERIATFIAEYFSNNKKSLPNADIKFIPGAQPLPFMLPKGDLICDVIPANPGILGSSSFSLIFKVDGKVVKNMSVRGKIEALAQIVIAAEPLKKGLVLEPQHLALVNMDIDDIATPEFDTSNLVGMQLTKAVSKGSPVLGSMVEEVSIIKRGQKVKIVIDSGALHLTTTGLAFTDGKLDQMIKVQNIESNKTLYGRVSGPGVVEVTL